MKIKFIAEKCTDDYKWIYDMTLEGVMLENAPEDLKNMLDCPGKHVIISNYDAYISGYYAVIKITEKTDYHLVNFIKN